MLKRVGKQDKFLVFSVPFIWIENMQQFLGAVKEVTAEMGVQL